MIGRRGAAGAAAVVALIALASIGRAEDEVPAAKRSARLEVESAQAMLAVQAIDGWLLHDHSDNPVARYLVAPSEKTTWEWFYFVPAQGQATLLCHTADQSAFRHIVVRETYSSRDELKSQLATLLKGASRVAMEYAPDSKVRSLTRVDANTVKLVTGLGPKVVSSAHLVQFTKARWTIDGRVAHYVAAHHLTKLRQEALAFIRDRLQSGEAVTEADVQRVLIEGYQLRGIEGPAPVVATGKNSASYGYETSRRINAPINKGDIVFLELAAQVVGVEQPVFAELSWVAYAGSSVPEEQQKLFAAIAGARDSVIAMLRRAIEDGRAVTGVEADETARRYLKEAGFDGLVAHATGHSIDVDRPGDGANLDAGLGRDTRALVQGTGFTVGPGLYRSDYGMRSVVSVHLGRRGVEVTTPAQTAITPILAP